MRVAIVEDGLGRCLLVCAFNTGELEATAQQFKAGKAIIALSECDRQFLRGRVVAAALMQSDSDEEFRVKLDQVSKTAAAAKLIGQERDLQ